MTKDINELLPIVQQKCEQFLAECKSQGIDVLVTGTYRTSEEQDALYAQGRTTEGSIVTDAKAGQSLHNWRVAFDCVPLVDGVPEYDEDALWSKMGQIANDVGLEWGGSWVSFPDKPHFQYTMGYTWEDFQAGTVDLTKFNLPNMETTQTNLPETVNTNETSASAESQGTSTGDAVQRVVINKTTLESYPVLSTTMDELDPANPKVEFTTSIGVITFTNIGNEGNLLNDEYTVKEI
jgi:peptidoglycan L-alanyl-D-glutamate endopeptidase CwlK